MHINQISEQIKLACIHANISLGELAKKFGSSQSGFSQRLNTGKFTKEELKQIANILGAEYVCYFKFPDGKEY